MRYAEGAGARSERVTDGRSEDCAIGSRLRLLLLLHLLAAAFQRAGAAFGDDHLRATLGAQVHFPELVGHGRVPFLCVSVLVAVKRRLVLPQEGGHASTPNTLYPVYADYPPDAPRPGSLAAAFPEYAAQLRLYGDLLRAAGVVGDRELQLGVLLTASGELRWL